MSESMTYIIENIMNYELLSLNNIIDIIIFAYVVYYFLFQSLYVGIIMNESIIIGIDLLKTCFLYDYKKKIYPTLMSILRPSAVNIDTNITYDKFNKLIETDMKNIIKIVKHNSVVFNPNNISIYNKYIFYIILMSISFLYKILFWTKNDSLINILLLMLTLRPFKTVIYNSVYYNRIVNKIMNNLNAICCYILSKISVLAINDLNMMCIGIHPNVRYYELLNFYENISSYKDDIIIVIKSILNHFIISSFKNSSSPFIKYIFTFIHKYQIEELSYITNILNNSKDVNIMTKEEIGEIIVNKKWTKLLSQKSINSILHILKIENNNTKYVNTNLNKMMFSVLRYFTLWTFVYVNPLIAIICDLIIIYKTHYKLTIYHIIAYLIGLYILIFSSLDVGTFICIYGSIFLKIIFNFIKDINVYRLYNYITKYIIASYIICIVSKLLFCNNLPIYKFVMSQMTVYFLLKERSVSHIIMSLIYLLSTIQLFNIYHLTIISVLFYIGTIFVCEPEYKLYFNLNEKYIKRPILAINPATQWTLFDYVEDRSELIETIITDDTFFLDKTIKEDYDWNQAINNMNIQTEKKYDDKLILDEYVILDNYM